jgi:cholesterol transport system auxiliary component
MTHPTHHRRAFLAVTASALALSGCGDLLGPPPAPQMYVVRPDFPAPATPPAKLAWSLSIMRPSAPGALDSDRIAILQPDAKMDYYADAQYPDALPGLVQTALLEGFEKNGALAGVARDSDALHADYDLFLDIKDFEARYAVADGVPEAMVTITARLATAHGRAIAGSLTLSQSVPASANSVGAATQALQQALTAVASGIVSWTLSFPAPPSQAVAPR